MTWYQRFTSFAPAGEQLADLSLTLNRLCRIGDTLLKAFVLAAWLYFTIEIGHGLLRHFGGR
jgi:hypothetical protein